MWKQPSLRVVYQFQSSLQVRRENLMDQGLRGRGLWGSCRSRALDCVCRYRTRRQWTPVDWVEQRYNSLETERVELKLPAFVSPIDGLTFDHQSQASCRQYQFMPGLKYLKRNIYYVTIPKYQYIKPLISYENSIITIPSGELDQL